ncbi:MAG: mechanosensitive ion channel family protein, partial [Candidatus Competibacteraceae bacterium]|nr:mechanosensitive ion channel family protein [Candidatus Competibacteraceae bacterium]
GVTNLLKNFVVNVVQKLVFFVGLIIALSMLEVNIGPFLAAIGAAGFIVGFALQGTLSNFAAGIMILLYRPYDVGDYVSVAGVSGTVEDMSLVSTTLRLPDNQIVIVPNGQIWGDVITNVTGTDKRRVDLVFGIGYDDDIQAAQDVLEDIINKHPQVLKEPAPVVRLHELADSSVNFVVRPWSKTSDYWAVYWDITRAVKERFDQADISIPYPQQDVHIRQSPNAPAAAAAPKTPAYETESGFARNDDAS